MNNGSRIKQERVGAGMTQSDLADRLGVARSTIQVWEASGANVPSTMIVEMCNIFGCTSDWLMGRSEIRNHGEARA